MYRIESRHGKSINSLRPAPWPTSAQVKAILGKPSVVAEDKIIYSLGAEKKTSAADFENLKQRNPQLSQDETSPEL